MGTIRLISKLQHLSNSAQKEKQLVEQATLDNISIHSGRGKTACTLSVIIVAFRESAKEIEHCLSSLLALLDSNTFELVCIDNGLDINSATILRGHSDRYIKSGENLGCCGGRNLGAHFAKNEVLMFLDADGELQNLDFSMVEQIRQKKLIAIRGRVVSQNPSKDPGHYDLGDHETPSLIDAEGISLWLRDAYVMAGGFNDNLTGNEGIVLAYRLITYYGANPQQFHYSPALELNHNFSGITRFPGHSKQSYYYVQFLYLCKTYTGIDSYIKSMIKLRKKTNYASNVYFFNKIKFYIIRKKINALFLLHQWSVQYRKPS